VAGVSLALQFQEILSPSQPSCAVTDKRVLSGLVPAYCSLDTRGVVIDGWFGVRGSLGVWSGLRLGEL